MAFQIKDFTSIVASMVNRAKATATKITDFRIGSVFRTLLESVAIEIDQLYQQMFNGLMDAIPVSVYNTFSFGLQDAVPSAGNIRVTITAQAVDVLVSANTVFTPVNGGPYTWLSADDFTIPAGQTYVDVLASANVGGLATNLPADTEFNPNPIPVGFVSAENLAGFNNGQDQETEAQRKVRFNQYIQALQHGTVAAIEYGASTTILTGTNGVEIERIRLCTVVEPYLTDDTQPIGLVKVYVHNGVGSTSSEIVTLCQEVINGYVDDNGVPHVGWKAAGVYAPVIAATEQPENITAVLTPSATYTGTTAALNTLAETAISNYQLSLGIGATMEIAIIMQLVMAIQGVANFILSTPSPTADVPATAGNYKIMPGVFDITNP